MPPARRSFPEGLDRMEFLDNRQFNGNAFTLLANAERFLRDTLPIAGRFEQDRFERIDKPLYPPLATREALANALCHRDYSIGGGSVGIAVYDDRLEVNVSLCVWVDRVPMSGRWPRTWTSRPKGLNGLKPFRLWPESLT